MKKLAIVFIALFTIAFTIPAYADIFGPRPVKKMSAVQGEQLAYPVDPGTILDYLTKIEQYLSPREGVFYDFNQSEFVNYAAATIYTYQPAGISLDFGALNTDGVALTIDWNAGAFIPADQVPLLNLVKYLYIGGGVGARDIDTGNGNRWHTAYGVDAQFKFTF